MVFNLQFVIGEWETCILQFLWSKWNPLFHETCF